MPRSAPRIQRSRRVLFPRTAAYVRIAGTPTSAPAMSSTITDVGDPKAKSPFSKTDGLYLNRNAKSDSSQFAMCSFDGWNATIELVHAARVDRCRAKPEMTKSLPDLKTVEASLGIRIRT